jgi:hypothetical protein
MAQLMCSPLARTVKPIRLTILPTGQSIKNNEQTTRLYVAGNYSRAGDICQLRHDGGIDNTVTERRGYIWSAN